MENRSKNIVNRKYCFFNIGLLMVLALILQFNKLNSYLIICNTSLFHRI